MRLLYIAGGVLLIVVIAADAGAASDEAAASHYPSKPIRILAAEPGGGGDFIARQVAQGISGPLGQPVIVENRGGASGSIAAQTVARAAPDGYTVLSYTGTFWVFPLLQKTSYDTVRDFSPVTIVVTSPNVVVASPSLSIKSVKELIALAKAKPGALNYASTGVGSSTQLATELFKSMAGVSMEHVIYKGSGQAVTALLGNQVQIMFATAPTVTSHIRSGALKGLAVTSARPSALMPDVPTVASSGLPGYESVLVYVVFAPAKTPATLINRLNQEIVRFVQTPEVKQRLLAAGVESAGSTPQELATTMKSEIARLGKVIKDLGIRLN